MHEFIHVKVKATNECEDEVQMLAICLLASLEQFEKEPVVIMYC
jgi:hypothetical protein